jgi:hypothetical protein
MNADAAPSRSPPLPVRAFRPCGNWKKITHTWMKVGDTWQIVGGMCGTLPDAVK